MCGTTTRAVTLAEVSKHCHKSDCWVIIHRNVYDVTKYIPEHPGGAMIYVKAGGDCSQLFDSYHTKPYVR
jgi:cytochrome b involved in lipid metabolism